LEGFKIEAAPEVNGAKITALNQTNLNGNIPAMLLSTAVSTAPKNMYE
jgi:hypothetical protein